MFKKLKNWYVTILLILGLTLVALPAHAEVKLNGSFMAQEVCPALQSIKKGTNPGNIKVTPGRSYDLLAKNKADASHYLIQVPKATPDRRWVAIRCGTIATGSAASTIAPSGGATTPIPVVPTPTPSPSNPGPDYLLAISWQPGFCQTHQSKVECRTESEDQVSAHNFSLHGLWPQPRGNDYCGVDPSVISLDKKSNWSAMPPLDVSPETLDLLAERMPGIQSNLDRHEWYKHGTCYGEPANTYFQEAVALLNQVDNSDDTKDSAVGNLFGSNIGNTLTAEQIRNSFDRSFGPGAGNKVNVKCDKGGLITELWINLRGNIELDTPIAELLQAAPNASTSCARGVVDPVGF